MDVTIASGVHAQILRHAAEDPAREVCGLLFGEAAGIATAEPTANVHADPARFFEVDPAALFAALRRERAGGSCLIGHYHSHPHGHAEPSIDDAAAVGSSFDRLWLIVAQGEIAAFRAVQGGAIHGRFDRVALMTAD